MRIFCFSIIILLSSLCRGASNDSPITALNDASFTIRYSHPDSSLLLAEKAYDLALKKKDDFELLRSINNKANHYRIVNENLKALTLFKEGVQQARKIQNKNFLSKIYNNMGLTFKAAAVYDSAIIYFHKSLRLRETSGSKANVLHNIGVTYSLIGDLENALRYFDQCKDIYAENNDTLGIAKIYNSRGAVYYKRGDYRRALQYYFKFLSHIPASNKWDEAIAYSNICSAYESLERLDSAFSYCLKALQVSQEVDDKRGVLYALSTLAKILARQNKNLQAIKIYRRAIELADSIGATNEKMEILLSLADAYKVRRQYDSSLLVIEEYIILKDSVLDIETHKSIIEEREKYNAHEKEKAIIKLQSEQRVDAEEKRTLQILIVSIIMLVIVLAFVIFYYRKAQLRKIRNAQERSISNAMLDAQEKERERISQEIHDDLGAKLSMLRMMFTSTRKDLPAKKYDPIDKLMLDSAVRSREISHELFSPTLKQFGLAAALKEVFSDLDEVKTECHFYFKDDFKGSLSNLEEINLFRITQELLNNTLKYARATEVNLRLTSEGGRFVYVYTDNGVGFNYDKASSGIGLSSIRNRVRRFSGKINIRSSEGAGVKVTISLAIIER